LFRTPTTTPEENEAFYQMEYKQGFTSDVPGDAELHMLLTSKFVGHEKDYATYIAILRALGVKPGQSILDFGCSWGYGSWQLKQAGYNVVGFEISSLRSEYARVKLLVDATDELERIGPDGSFDVFFSAHVLEHLPNLADTIAFAKRKLKPDGLFIGFTPNGSAGFRQLAPANWRQIWGLVHPNLLDDVYYRRTFPKCLLASPPYVPADLGQRWKDGDNMVANLGGCELMVATQFSP
jgi:2-polyprenyl-3-methyl-5-hydroxy-6-metoxy-1,4-benzoquinol methylase